MHWNNTIFILLINFVKTETDLFKKANENFIEYAKDDY